MIMQQGSLHEDLSRRQEGHGSSDRSFGLVFAAFFLLVGLTPLRLHHPVRWWAVAVAVAFALVGLVTPAWLRPMNRIWSELGLLLGRMVNPLVTGILFFLVVTPIGLLARLRRKDPLRLTRVAGATTYWIERKPAGPPPATMSNQF